MTDAVLVVDVGTSSVRSSLVDANGVVSHTHQVHVVPSSPAPGLVELDAPRIAAAALETAHAVLAEVGSVAAVGIANQRASAIVWDRRTGEVLGPALGWQDLRTVIQCLVLQGEGLRLAPNVTATKLQAILDLVDPERRRSRAGELCCGTVDAFVAWHLSGAAVFVTDASNAGVTGLVDASVSTYDDHVLTVLGIDRATLPDLVDTSGVVGLAHALPGAPPIAGMAGDQQASLIGQGCTRPGMAKITFGTGGMLDVVVGDEAPAAAVRGPHGTFPIVAQRAGGRTLWGREAVMLSAGTCVEWLRDDLGFFADAADCEALAASCDGTGGVTFVPAMLGLGTPVWDFGARGALLGLTRGTGRAEITRAVLDGIAHRGADLVEATEAEIGYPLAALRVDGGMSQNATFLQLLANATGKAVERSAEVEATTRGAGFLAALGVGLIADADDLDTLVSPSATFTSTLDDDERLSSRSTWLDRRGRAEGTIPDLSSVEF